MIVRRVNIKCIVIETRNAIITGKDEEKNTLTVFNYDAKILNILLVKILCVTRLVS